MDPNTNNSIEPGTKFKEYTSFVSDIDLVAASPNGAQAARTIRVVALANGSTSASIGITTLAAGSDPLTMIAGDIEIGQFKTIVAATTSGAARIRVGW